MKQIKYSFKSEKLQVDYITFNLKNGKNSTQKIAHFFNRYHRFNCYFYDQKAGSEKKKPYLDIVNPSYELEMVFVFNANPVNRNTILIQFSGRNAYYFYRILKTQEFNWQIFNLNDLTIGRFDISYIRSNNRIEKSNLLLFLERSADKFKTRYPSSDPLIIGTTLGLGTRTGDYFLRIYSSAPDNDSLKFELEIKKYKAKQITPFLIQNSFVEFENSIVESFFRYLKIALVFDTCYTDWLLIRLRDTKKPTNYLISNYLNKNLVTYSMDDKLTFYRVLQFLSFTRTRHFKKEILNGEFYYTFSFPLIDFAKRINLYPLDTYRRKKLLTFLEQIHNLPPIYQWFSDFEFRSSLVFPVIRVKNQTSKHTKLIIHITVSESFYKLQYPFYFPDSFYTFENKYDLISKFAIIKSISSQFSTRKVLHLEDLFKGLNNQNKTYIKNNIIQQFQHLNHDGFIHNEFHLVQKDKEIIQVNKLTKELLNSTQQLIFYENIKPKI